MRSRKTSVEDPFGESDAVSQGFVLGLCLGSGFGMLFGLIVGASSGNVGAALSIGMTIGAGFGMCVGLVVGQAIRKHNEKKESRSTPNSRWRGLFGDP